MTPESTDRVHERIDGLDKRVNEIDRRQERCTAQIEESSRNIGRLEKLTEQQGEHIRELRSAYEVQAREQALVCKSVSEAAAVARASREIAEDARMDQAPIREFMRVQRERRADWRRTALRILAGLVVAAAIAAMGWLAAGGR